MSLTPTASIPLGFKAPAFSLPNVVSHELMTFTDVRGSKGTLVMFICNHCPYVIHVREELIRLANDYKVKGFGFVAMIVNFAVSLVINTFTPEVPEEVQEIVENIRIPSGAGEATH